MSEGVKWNLDSFFPKFLGKEMLQFKKEMVEDIDKLKESAKNLAPLGNNNMDQWEKMLLDNEKLSKRLSHYWSYVGCLNANDAKNEEYSKESAALAKLGAEYEKLGMFIELGFKEVDDETFETFCNRDSLVEAKFYLKELRQNSRRKMSADLEALSADLGIDGPGAWNRLYDTITGKMTFDMHWPDGKVETLPIAQRRSIMQDADRKVRQAAFECGNKAWEKVEDICGAALNAIAGTRLILNKRRGYNHFLDVSLEQARITRKTLDAMFKAIADNLDFARELGRAKAKIMGLDGLAWYDCEAPVPIPGLKRFTWEECVEIVDSSFSKSCPELGEFYRKALENKWVESEPREGKRPGAFCTGSLLTDESRVFMTFSGSLPDVSTLAHEIGHAFHSFQMHGLRPYLREYPMTLAESASTFAEMLLADGIIESTKVTDAEKLDALTATLNHGVAFLIDIPIRFKFEKIFHEERMKGEVTVSRLKEIMSEVMKEQFGDLLLENGENPYFWASKMHFYLTDVTFYNYPYSFGYLLSRGLFAMFKKDKKAFLPKYREFLRYSGSDMAHEVARKTIGADLEDTKFWTEAILSHKAELDMFNELASKVMK